MSLPNENPYAAPRASLDTVVASEGSSELEAIRRKHINAERTIRSFGSLAYLGAVMLFLGGIGILTAISLSTTNVAMMSAFGIGYLVMGGLSFYVGRLLRQLHPRGRMIQTVMLVLGLVSLAMASSLYALPGAVFWGLIYALIFWTPKANVVFSEHYREVVIPATPHVKPRTSLVTWIVLGVLILVILGAVVAERMS